MIDDDRLDFRDTFGDFRARREIGQPTKEKNLELINRIPSFVQGYGVRGDVKLLKISKACESESPRPRFLAGSGRLVRSIGNAHGALRKPQGGDVKSRGNHISNPGHRPGYRSPYNLTKEIRNN